MNIFKSKLAFTSGDVSPEYIYICEKMTWRDKKMCVMIKYM